MTLKDRDKKYIWHPFDQMKGSDILPISRGEGAYVYDEQNNRYIDGFSSWWVNGHGHSNPYIAQKIHEQMNTLEHIAFGGFTHKPAVDLAETIVQITPDEIKKVFFSDNGSTANEVAIKMSMQYWFNKGEKRNKFIAFEGAYHGDTFGSMCVTARGGFNEPFEHFMFDVDFIPLPTMENFDSVVSKFTSLVEKDDICAFIFEPLVQGASGMNMYSPASLSKLLEIAKQYGVLTIADEVFTGFGRTGSWFASDYLNEKPDIMCLSKTVTGGFLPLGLTAVNELVFNAFYSDEQKHTFLHGHSYTGNPLCCASANAALELMHKDDFWPKLKGIENRISYHISRLKTHEFVRDARCVGAIGAIEVDRGGKSSYFNDSGKEIYKKLLQKGVILRPLGNVFPVVVPYCIQENDIDHIFNSLEEILNNN
ncbi:MAG: adenosylmethionine--8-amino-7-oxononanoate transaminase [Bacteroidota bacterium]|nr:adenosylmethionine--8-amino-7-oxononanoate transaminase [Bacteroidota bacterium]